MIDGFNCTALLARPRRVVDAVVRPTLVACVIATSVVLAVNVRVLFAMRAVQATFAPSPLPSGDVPTTGEIVRRLNMVEADLKANASADSLLALRQTSQESDITLILWLLKTMTTALVGQYLIAALKAFSRTRGSS